MKNTIARAAILIVAGFVVLSAATPSQTTMRANIPFAFLAGDQIHPAGDYWVVVNSEFRYVSLRPLKSATRQRVPLNGTFVQRNGLNVTAGFLRFERYGDTYALSAVGVPEAGSGLGVAPSSAEKELAKTNAAGGEVEVSLIQ